jgi:hypothetical protein
MTNSLDEPVATSTLSLIALVGCMVPFFPPFLAHTTGSVLLIVFLGTCIALTFTLHLVFLGIAARRVHRSAVLWVFVAVFFFPIGSIVGLILFERFGNEHSASPDAKSAA